MSPETAQLVFLLAIGVVFYLVLIRPQQRRTRAHAELVAALAVGDRVVTIGGIVGAVTALDEDTILLSSDGTMLRIARQAVARRIDIAGPSGESV